VSLGEELLTLPQAQSRLKMKGPRGLRLKRYLLAKEKRTGKQIMQRLGGGKRASYRVTMSLLRKHCPELFKSKVDELQSNFRRYLSHIDARIREHAAEYVAEHVDPRLQELWQRDEMLAENLDELGKRVAEIVGTKKHVVARG